MSKIQYICGSKVDIIEIADDFYEAYKRCIEEKNTRKLEDGRMCSDVVNIPAIVNGAFACELYLKSMQEEISGHELKELFTSLTKELQEKIRNSIEPKLEEIGKSFDECLEGLSNSFCYWRYVFEKEQIEGLGFQDTLKVLPLFMKTFKEVSQGAKKKMRLKDAFKMVSKTYYGNPATVYKGKKVLICSAFVSLIDFANKYDFEMLDDEHPFEWALDGKTLVFRVK